MINIEHFMVYAIGSVVAGWVKLEYKWLYPLTYVLEVSI
jgi:hypothetical protein